MFKTSLKTRLHVFWQIVFSKKKNMVSPATTGIDREKNANLPSGNETWLTGESLQMAVPIGKCSEHVGDFFSKTCWINKRIQKVIGGCCVFQGDVFFNATMCAGI